MIFLYVATDSYASRAKVLVDSIKKYHPNDLICHLAYTDAPVGQYIPGMAKARLEKALELLCTTEEDVAIIGADCELFARIGHVQDLFADTTDVVIVPHVKYPLKDREYMAQIYQTGHANADFIAFRNCYNSKKILKWLISVVEDGAKPGAFYEQTWVSSLPFLFDCVTILRHPCYNLAYWDINHVEFDYTGGEYSVFGAPLVMFHYSGYVKGKPREMSKYSKEVAANSDIYQFYKNYDDKIEK